MSEKIIAITIVAIAFIIFVGAITISVDHHRRTAKKCSYDVYQNGVVIDTVTREYESCSSFGGGIGSGLYYKSISEVSK
jgi:hypothetical protein